jgi:potassium-transporting ATPase KdpC subunit
MVSAIRPAIAILGLLSLLTGLAYPLAVTALAQIALSGAANGSLVLDGKGAVVGSRLIGQTFVSDRYFRGRPSATTAPDPNDSTKTVDAPYNAANSGGSNLGPTSAALVERVRKTLADEGGDIPFPADGATTSASGLDPDISPEFARRQTARVAHAHGVEEAKVAALVDANVVGRTLGVFGEPRINVLTLNLALDALK